MLNFVKLTYIRKLILSGEFGVVYRGQLTGWGNSNSTELVAVKTLKGNDNNKTINIISGITCYHLYCSRANNYS